VIKKPLSEIVSTVGAPISTIENWLMPDRFQLSTNFEQTTRGRARLFTRANTLELALIAAFIKAGAQPSGAAAFAAAVLRADSARAPIREWWVFPAGNARKGKQLNRLSHIESLEPLLETDAIWPPVLIIVRVGEIARRVNALFAAKE
jgi:hypothetical protein